MRKLIQMVLGKGQENVGPNSIYIHEIFKKNKTSVESAKLGKTSDLSKSLS